MITLNLEKQGETLIFFGEPDPSAPILEFECAIAPGKEGPEPHIHPLQTETFHVVQGRLRAVVDGEERLVDQGEKLVIPPGAAHTFSNPNPEERLRMRVTIEPALNFQWYLTESARSAIRNGGRWKDASLLEVCYILNQVVDEHDFPGMSPRVKRFVFGALGRLALLLNRTGNVAPLSEHAVASGRR